MSTGKNSIPLDTVPFAEWSWKLADIHQVDPLDVLLPLLLLAASSTGSGVGMEGGAQAPPPSLLLACGRDGAPAWLASVIEALAGFQRVYSARMGSIITEIQDPSWIRKQLEAARHLREFDGVFDREANAIEGHAAMHSRAGGWLYYHMVGSDGAMVPRKGTRRGLTVIVDGRKDLKKFTRQADHPAGLPARMGQGNGTPRVHLFGRVGESTLLRAMRKPRHPLATAPLLVLPVAAGIDPGHQPHLVWARVFDQLGAVLSRRWIE